MPMMAKYSGSATSCAPAAAAIAISRAASFRLALTFGPEAICTPAMRTTGAAGARAAGLSARARPKEESGLGVI